MAEGLGICLPTGEMCRAGGPRPTNEIYRGSAPATLRGGHRAFEPRHTGSSSPPPYPALADYRINPSLTATAKFMGGYAVALR